MKFFDRREEIAELRRIRAKSHENAQFTVITGRRRVGKTELVKHAFEDEGYLYFYVSKKSQPDLCESFRQIAERALGVSIPGRIERFQQLFRFVLEQAVHRPLTLFIDEFQDFLKIDESIINDIAGDWDEFHGKSKINLIVCGSINRLMGEIFEDKEAPLYGRNTASFRIEPFRVSVLKEILAYHHPHYKPDDLLALWAFTGGIARHVALLMDDKAYTPKKMVESMIRLGSTFLDEGKTLLVEEFGKEYGTYFTVLSSIAAGRTTRNEIEQTVGGSAGGYLTKLEGDYSLIAKRQPLFEKSANKNCIYRLNDNFLTFWFRFIYKYNYLIELKMFDELRKIILDDYAVFSGWMLEGYFKAKFAESHLYTRMGAWWDRKGENEIDLVCENELTGKIDFYEIKRDAGRIKMGTLKNKVAAFFEKNPNRHGKSEVLHGLSLADL